MGRVKIAKPGRGLKRMQFSIKTVLSLQKPCSKRMAGNSIRLMKNINPQMKETQIWRKMRNKGVKET
jgi:hypothetical protein